MKKFLKQKSYLKKVIIINPNLTFKIISLKDIILYPKRYKVVSLKDIIF